MTFAIVGIGKPGVPAGDVLSVQGVAGGTPVPVTPSGAFANPSIANITQVAQTNVTGTILAAAPTRLSYTVENASADPLDIRESAGPATALNRTIRILPNGSWTSNYTGIVTGLWTLAGAGQANVTERLP